MGRLPGLTGLLRGLVSAEGMFESASWPLIGLLSLPFQHSLHTGEGHDNLRPSWEVKVGDRENIEALSCRRLLETCDQPMWAGLCMHMGGCHTGSSSNRSIKCSIGAQAATRILALMPCIGVHAKAGKCYRSYTLQQHNTAAIPCSLYRHTWHHFKYFICKRARVKEVSLRITVLFKLKMPPVHLSA